MGPRIGQGSADAGSAVVIRHSQGSGGLYPNRGVVVNAGRSDGIDVAFGRRLQRCRRISGEHNRNSCRDSCVLDFEALSAVRLDGHGVRRREADGGVGVASVDDLVGNGQVARSVQIDRLRGGVGDEDVLDANAPAYGGAAVA